MKNLVEKMNRQIKDMQADMNRRNTIRQYINNQRYGYNNFLSLQQYRLSGTMVVNNKSS